MSLKQGLMPHEKLSPLRDADPDVSTRIASEPETGAIDPAWIVDSNGIAEILMIQPRTVRFWVRNKKLPVLKLSPRCQISESPMSFARSGDSKSKRPATQPDKRNDFANAETDAPARRKVPLPAAVGRALGSLYARDY
jgi:hypothetical protein